MQHRGLLRLCIALLVLAAGSTIRAASTAALDGDQLLNSIKAEYDGLTRPLSSTDIFILGTKLDWAYARLRNSDSSRENARSFRESASEYYETCAQKFADQEKARDPSLN